MSGPVSYTISYVDEEILVLHICRERDSANMMFNIDQKLFDTYEELKQYVDSRIPWNKFIPFDKFYDWRLSN